jgi:hypothetical protein
MNNRQTSNLNRPTAVQQVVAADLAALGTMIIDLAREYERDAVAGNATWDKVGFLQAMRERAVQIIAADRLTPGCDELEVEAEVLAEAQRRVRS